MGVYLAVDADGTKTECLIADDERVLSRVTGETVSLAAVGTPEATRRLRYMLDEASGMAKVPLYLINCACVGLAELSSEGVRAWAEDTLGSVLTGDLILSSAEDIALEAAFDNGPGVLVIAGAGSQVVGRTSNGLRVTAGGWGPTLGDEGSAHWIGLEGLRSGLRAMDRGVSSCLLREIQQLWQTPGVGALIAEANNRPSSDFVVLAETVARCAAQGDALAASVLERAGEELAALVSLVVAKMRASGCDWEDCERVAIHGSVLSRVQPVHGAMTGALHRSYPEICVDQRVVEPLEGALARARRR